MTWVVLSFALLSLVSRTEAVITIKDNGYQGITVAIHPNVPDDPELVQSIKNLFLSGSSFLYQATRHRAYFNEVTIIVPNEWEYRPEYEIVRPNSRFSVADVRIDLPNPEYGDAPYTQQPGECGESGEYIHLTPDFIKGLDRSGASAYGDPGRALIHEWSHLRYGVFDEHGFQHDSRTPPFYLDESGQIKYTACTSDVPGWLRDTSGGPCTRKEDGLPGDDCLFYPDMEHATAKASVMSMPYLPSVDGFCDSSPEREHNARAPNMHNLMCQGRSTWDVLMDHPDFLRDRNGPREDVDIVTLFRVVQPKKDDKPTFVLVLDVSASMRGRKMDLLHRAAARFVRFQLRDYSSLGIVAFSTDVKVLANITTLDKVNRTKLVDTVPNQEDEGYTSIGRGLLEGLALLKRSREPMEGALLLLVSDGEENMNPRVLDILPQILAARVVINTIAFGLEATSKLETLVKATGGRGFFFDDKKIGHKALDAAFLASATTQADLELQPVEVINRYTYMEKMGSVEGNFTLDKEIGMNTAFLVTFDFPDLQVALVSPSGKKYSELSKEYTVDLKTNTISIDIPKAEPGLWEYFITNLETRMEQDVSVIVTSEPRDIREQPIRVRAWVAEVDLTYPAQAKVYAEVKKEYNAIIGASVIATIDGPLGEPHVMMLYDNGQGADTIPDDGIYSGFFTNFNGSGRYSVEAVVVNNGKARMKTGSRASPSPPLPRISPELVRGLSPQVSFSPKSLKERGDRPKAAPLLLPEVAMFERTVSGGSFKLQNWTNRDLIPPNKITDLEVISFNTTGGVIELIWTSPGDDMDKGNAERVELRYHTDRAILLLTFDKAWLLEETNITAGNLTEVPAAGEEHWIQFKIPVDKDSGIAAYYFAVVAYDEAGNRGQVSNIAEAHWSYGDSIPMRPVDGPASYSLLAILLAVGGALALLIILFIVAVSIRNRRRKRKYKCKHENTLLPTKT
uniref:EClCP n=1 Tax=Hemiscolopendra marginata TaxID=943146 RepID=A0A646QFV9_9MYRI